MNDCPRFLEKEGGGAHRGRRGKERSYCKTIFPVILNEVKDLNVFKLQDYSLRAQ